MHDSTTETTYDINDNISRDTNNMSSNNNDDSMDCSNDLPDTEVSSHPSHKNDEDKVESSDVSPVANYSLPDRSTVDLANLSNTSISPNEPFINFLHDFSIQRNTKPIESYDDAVLAWSLMEQEEKAAYEPENYVLKLFMRDENFSKQFSGESMEVDDQDESSASDDDEITVILPPPSERKSNKAGTTRRALKKPRKRLNAGAKQSSSENKLGKRSSSLQNFLAFMHQKLKKYDSFDKTLLGTTLWRHMTSLEKNQFDNNDYLYKLKKGVKDEGVQTMPCLPCSKSTQVSTEDFSIVSSSNSKSLYIDQSQCSINSRSSSELSHQSSLHSSNKTLKFETSTVSDNSVLESEAFASDNLSQTMDSENDSNNQSGKEWSFLKYFRWR
ncbi:dentin sialophosphoprotein isoform X2 [Drosophila bipectinata]|nr:uncharacterized protein LOC122321500 [Drosophila bipectinata]